MKISFLVYFCVISRLFLQDIVDLEIILSLHVTNKTNNA